MAIYGISYACSSCAGDALKIHMGHLELQTLQSSIPEAKRQGMWCKNACSFVTTQQENVVCLGRINEDEVCQACCATGLWLLL